MAVRNLRNWWIEVEIDGRKTKLVGGPRAKDGGFNLKIYQRSYGRSILSVEISGSASDPGEPNAVITECYPVDGADGDGRGFTVTTQR